MNVVYDDDVGETSPSSLSIEARVLATSSESRLSASLGDLATKFDMITTLVFVFEGDDHLAIVGLSSLESSSPLHGDKDEL